MKKALITISKTDYQKLCLFVVLNAVLCCMGIGVVFIRMFIKYTLSLRGETANLILQLILLAIFAIPAVIFINKFRIWLFSLPIQFLLNLIVIKLIYGDSIAVIIRFHMHIWCAQLIGVIVGLFVRNVVGYFIRKVTAKRHRTI